MLALISETEFSKKFADLAKHTSTFDKYVQNIVPGPALSTEAMAAFAAHMASEASGADILQKLRQNPGAVPASVSDAQLERLVDSLVRAKTTLMLMMSYIQEDDTLFTDRLFADIVSNGFPPGLPGDVLRLSTIPAMVQGPGAVGGAELAALIKSHILAARDGDAIIAKITKDPAVMQGFKGILGKKDFAVIVKGYTAMEAYANELLLHLLSDKRLLDLLAEHLVHGIASPIHPMHDDPSVVLQHILNTTQPSAQAW
ncbi:MAG: hypothetical protein MRJ68_18045 [Nitrospira sp.]|nr:hypothetical protein [Nitrospira sp.]